MSQTHDPGWEALAASAIYAPNDFWRLRWVAVELPSELTGIGARIVMLLGGALPTGSVDVLSAYGIVLDAEQRGRATPGRTTFLSPFTGALGPGAAWVARRRGYRHTVICPAGIEDELRAAQRIYGTELIDVSAVGERELLERVAELSTDPDVAVIAPYESMAAYHFHHGVTGGAILGTIEGTIAAVVSSAGEPATFAAADRVKETYPESLTVAVESGEGGALWKAAWSDEQCDSLVPLNLNLDRLDRVARVDPALCAAVRDYCVRELGYRWDVGFAAIANLIAAIQVGRAEEFTADDIVIVVGTDGGDGSSATEGSSKWRSLSGLRELDDEGLADLTPPSVRERLWTMRNAFWSELVPKEELRAHRSAEFWREVGAQPLR